MAVNTIVSDGEYTGMGMYIMDRKSLISVIEYSVSHGLCHFEKDFCSADLSPAILILMCTNSRTVF